MSAGDHVDGGCARSGDAAAYALGALEPDEAEEFRAHLSACAACRDDVAAFEGVTRGLPAASVQYAAPKDLRKRVLKEVRATPQEGPSRTAKPDRVRRPALIPRRAIAGLGAAAAVVLAVVVGVVIGSSGGAGTRVVEAQVVGAAGSAEVRIAGGRADLIVRDLPAPAPGRIYEVWLERGQSRPSPTSTLFSVSSTGAGEVGVAGGLNGVTKLLVTSEPAGGSRAPTRPPLIVARLS